MATVGETSATSRAGPCCNGKDTSLTCQSTCAPSKTKTFIQIATLPAIDDNCTYSDECAAHPCNGICINTYPGSQCSCPTKNLFLDESGTNCIDNCTGVVCQIDNICKADQGPWTCGCNLASKGMTCDVEEDLCLLNSRCKNGGSCRVTVNQSIDCDCAVGYVGAECEEEITDCARKPCRHGGTCKLTEDDVGFECQCLEGFSGSVCEVVRSELRKELESTYDLSLQLL